MNGAAQQAIELIDESIIQCMRHASFFGFFISFAAIIDWFYWLMKSNKIKSISCHKRKWIWIIDWFNDSIILLQWVMWLQATCLIIESINLFILKQSMKWNEIKSNKWIYLFYEWNAWWLCRHNRASRQWMTAAINELESNSIDSIHSLRQHYYNSTL